MAFVDGELPPAERVRIAGLIDADEALQRRLEDFMATSQPQLRPAFQTVVDAPVPQRLIETIWQHGPDAATSTVAGLRSGGAANDSRSRLSTGTGSAGRLMTGLAGWWGVPAMAAVIAGSAVVAVGGVAGWLLNDIIHPRPKLAAAAAGADIEVSGLVDGAVLLTALERSPMGQSSEGQQAGGSVTPVFSFRSKQSEFCRVYETANAVGQFRGVACKGGDGQWRLAVHAATGRKAQSGGGSEGVKPASGGKASLRQVESTIDRLQEGDVLGREDEAELIRRGWKMKDR